MASARDAALVSAQRPWHAAATRSRTAAPRGRVFDDEIDAGKLSFLIEQLLRGGHVGDDEILERARGELAGQIDTPHEDDFLVHAFD